MAENFTLLKDTNNIPVCAFQIGANALNHVLWAAVKVTNEVQTTDESGFFQCAHYPLIDIDGDGAITAVDVLPRNNSTGAALYVGTAASDLNSRSGRFKLYSDAGLTTPTVSTAVKCTYYYASPVSVDSSGRLVLGPSSQNIGDVDVLTTPADATPGSAAPAKGFLVVGSDGTNARAVKVKSGGQVESCIVNSDGTRTVYIQQSLGDQEDFVTALATSGFMLVWDPTTNYWKRFTGKITADDGGMATIGTKGDAAVTNPSSSASEIALLKGLLKQLQGTGTGGAPTVRRGKLHRVNYDQASPNVVAGGTKLVTIQPPAGELWRVSVFSFLVPAITDAAGDQIVFVSEGLDDEKYGKLYMSGTNGSILQFKFNHIRAASGTKIPSSEQMQMDAVKSLTATNDQPIYWKYINGTDKTQNGTLEIDLLVEVEYIAS